VTILIPGIFSEVQLPSFRDISVSNAELEFIVDFKASIRSRRLNLPDPVLVKVSKQRSDKFFNDSSDKKRWTRMAAQGQMLFRLASRQL
jgi:hypothetical protein